MIEVERRGTVAVVRLARGKVNALDVETLDALVEQLEAVTGAGQPEVRSVVLAAEGRVFSAGVDLTRYLDGGPAYTERLLGALDTAVRTLFELPVPTVAAISGAAVAGGCVLACACDRRVLADTARIGATELEVGVAFPVSALEVLRHACGDRTEDVVYGAQLHDAQAALALRLVHEVVPAATVLATAIERAERLGSMSPAAFRLAKAQLHRPATDRMADAGPLDDAVGRVWTAPGTVDAVRRAVEGR